MNALTLIILALIAGASAGYLAADFNTPSQEDLIKEFYDVENAVHVSPHSIRKDIMNGALSVTLVDLRSEEEYAAEHITGAVNIPAYRDPETPAYYDTERIIAAFKALPDDKPVVVYC
ncbi:rhodanese-like domain-containing protein, partial [Candidatus Woesearchaeota archaeon]|nr:rhodanese-like domain-containing protein [Candidatus Woesearchaeota archaeon]